MDSEISSNLSTTVSDVALQALSADHVADAMPRVVADEKVKNRKSKRAGQGLVEFALVMPVLLLLVMGIVDFGWMLFNYSQLYNGLREGLRYGSVPGYSAVPQYEQCDTIRQRIMALAGSSGIQASNITIIYDDGRVASVPGPSTSEVATCPSGSTVTFYANYTPIGSASAAQQTALQAGDRIIIDMDVTVQFLTPVIRPFASGGMRIHLQAARSIFPDGLAVNN